MKVATFFCATSYFSSEAPPSVDLCQRARLVLMRPSRTAPLIRSPDAPYVPPLREPGRLPAAATGSSPCLGESISFSAYMQHPNAILSIES